MPVYELITVIVVRVLRNSAVQDVSSVQEVSINKNIEY